MEELTRFRLLNDELNDQCIIECIKLKGSSLFTRALFKEYEKQPESIIPLTNITTNIINARKPTQNQQLQIDSFNSLDQLPSELINKCASFLETYEYIQLVIQIEKYTNKFIIQYQIFQVYQCAHLDVGHKPKL